VNCCKHSTDGGVAAPIVSGSRDPAGDPLTLAERDQTLVSDELALPNLVLITLHHAICCHALEKQGDGGACLFGHPQRLINLRSAETVAGLVRIHRQGGEHCPLVGCAECLAIGDGSEHVSGVN